MTNSNMGTKKLIQAGLLGGVAGGLLFGAMMGMMGMLPMIASMVGSSLHLVGFAIHMMMSVGIGLGFVLLVGRRLGSFGQTLGLGVGYGAVWWVLGPLLMMPLIMGGQFFDLGPNNLLSLMGHIIYGVVLAFVARAVTK